MSDASFKAEAFEWQYKSKLLFFNQNMYKQLIFPTEGLNPGKNLLFFLVFPHVFTLFFPTVNTQCANPAG